MTPDQATIEHLRTQYADCFGCGRDNATGLHIDGFTVHGRSVTTTATFPERFAGFRGVLHGGVVATALDEVSAWSAMLTEGVFVYTARLDLAYRAKVPTATPVTLTGTVVDRRGRRLTIESVVSEVGRTLAESHGVFVVAAEVDPTR